MKILLIFPSEKPLSDIKECPKLPSPPLGICYLASVLEKAYVSVSLLDCNVATRNEISNAINYTDIVGISAPTVLANAALELASYAKQLDKVVIVGGPHATISPEFFLKSGRVDFVVRGEGEYTLLNILQKIKQGDSAWEEVKGISYVKDGRIIHNPDRPLIKNLDEIPFPARHMLPIPEYFKRWRKYTGYTQLNIMTSRGCPFACIFCAKEIFGRIYRVRSPQNVVNEIESLVEKYKVDRIFLCDDVFTLDKQRVLEICKEIRRRGLVFEWACEARVDSVDYKLLKAMRDANCKIIHYGVESGSQRILGVLNKRINVDQIKKATSYAKRVGMLVSFYIIIGSPTETVEDIKLTRKLIFETKPDYLDITVFAPLPGTVSWEMLKDRIVTYDLTNYDYTKGLIFHHEHFSYEELEQIRNKLLKQFRARLFLWNLASPMKILYVVKHIRQALWYLRISKRYW